MSLHDERIAEIVAKHGALTKNFRINVQNAVRPTMVEEWGDEPAYHAILDREAMASLRVRPDAYLIVPQARLLICWEVEHHHRYEAGKYSDVFWFLDEFYWTLKIVALEAVYGAHRTINAVEEAYAEMRRQKDEAECQN